MRREFEWKSTLESYGTRQTIKSYTDDQTRDMTSGESKAAAVATKQQ